MDLQLRDRKIETSNCGVDGPRPQTGRKGDLDLNLRQRQTKTTN
jgi:hypothetical protein